MTRYLVSLLVAACFALPVAGDPTFPGLSGRVVDQAGLLSKAAVREITGLSGAHEAAGGNQVVVVTVPDLQGYTIEDYGFQLGRAWGIGQQGKDNGVLLLVAKAERKVRIEVGYGLEGDLTDAIASNIISTIITPAFKRAQFDEGCIAGTRAIIEALGGQYRVREVTQSNSREPSWIWNLLILLVVFFIFPGFFRRSGFFGGLLLGSLLGGGRGGGRGGGFGGGGFSGGGGSFGGGGASGGW